MFVCQEPTDMRASYDSLFAKSKSILNQDPSSGHLFLFINGKRTSIKCLFYDLKPEMLYKYNHNFFKALV